MCITALFSPANEGTEEKNDEDEQKWDEEEEEEEEEEWGGGGTEELGPMAEKQPHMIEWYGTIQCANMLTCSC